MSPEGLCLVASQEEMVGLGALREFLGDAAIFSMGSPDGLDATADSVRLTTLHGSKGLEFDTVFIIGESFLPTAHVLI